MKRRLAIQRQPVRRLVFLEQLPLLELTEAVDDVAQTIMDAELLPSKAAHDAIHIAVVSVHRIDILLTWNCRHIANGTIMKELRAVVADAGYELPILCTPEELMGD